MDLLAIYRIETQAFDQPWPFEAFEQFLGVPGFLVAEDGSVLGYIVVDTTLTPGGPVGHIKDLAVHEQRQGEGIGSLLVQRGLAAVDGVTDAVKLEVRESNERAIDLYRRHGFRYHRRVSEYYEDGEDALVFVRATQ